MTSRSGRLPQDRNLGVHIDGEASFKGKKKTRRAGVRKSIGDSANSGEPSIINQPCQKKAQDGPLISGKQVKSKKLASVKEEAVPSKDKNLDSKRTASKVPILSEIRRLGRVGFVRAYPEFIDLFFLEPRPKVKVVFQEFEPKRSDLEDWDEKFDLESD